jgi:hypothetical protein
MLIQIATHQPQMLSAIVKHTPIWVWGLLAALLWLGIRQMFPRSVGTRQVLLLPLGMAVFSAYGLASAFGGSAGVVTTWLLTAVAVAVASLLWRPLAPTSIRYDAAQGRLHLPGSAMPLALILGIFLTKYIVGVELALQPALAHDTGVALQVAVLYGVFNGVFAARAARLWRLAQRTTASPQPLANA